MDAALCDGHSSRWTNQSILPFRDRLRSQKLTFATFRLLTSSSRSLSSPDLSDLGDLQFLLKPPPISDHSDSTQLSFQTPPTSPLPPETINRIDRESQTDPLIVDHEECERKLKTTRDLLKLFEKSSLEEDYSEIPPVPVPRNKTDRKSSKGSSDVSSSSRCATNSPEVSETTTASIGAVNQPEEAIYPTLTFDEDEEEEDDEFDYGPDDESQPSSSGSYFDRGYLPRPPLPTNSRFAALFKDSKIPTLSTESSSSSTANVKRRAKESFRNLIKINKITSNKLLSIKLRDAQGTIRKKISSLAAFDALGRSQKDSRQKIARPTRQPPPPPILIFRPPAPDPTDEPLESVDDLYEEPISLSNGNKTDGDDVSELYQDTTFVAEIIEGIYSSVDEVEPNGTKDTTGEEAQTNGGSERKDSEPYYTSGSSWDGEGIYEELSHDDDGTVYEESPEEGEQIYGNIEEVCRTNPEWEREQAEKELKRIRKLAKTMKKFNLQGNEVPINSGVILSDRRGIGNNLYVRKGETVLIIRMDGNPPGKWLAKNERSKIGYVDPDNVAFDTDSIAAVITSFHNCKLK